MANEQNLRPIRKGDLSKEELKKRKSNGGKASVKARKEKKLFKEVIEEQLGANIEDIVKAMMKQSKKGNVQAATWLRDTAGQKPVDKVEAEVGITNIRVELEDE